MNNISESTEQPTHVLVTFEWKCLISFARSNSKQSVFVYCSTKWMLACDMFSVNLLNVRIVWENVLLSNLVAQKRKSISRSYTERFSFNCKCLSLYTLICAMVIFLMHLSWLARAFLNIVSISKQLLFTRSQVTRALAFFSPWFIARLCIFLLHTKENLRFRTHTDFLQILGWIILHPKKKTRSPCSDHYNVQ